MLARFYGALAAPIQDQEQGREQTGSKISDGYFEYHMDSSSPGVAIYEEIYIHAYLDTS